jgi:putative ABC transport system ATP-binding protein
MDTAATQPYLHLEDISHRYQIHHTEIPVLERIQLRVNSGTFILIDGPSGSGKTTLLHIIAGLLTPTGGSVRFHGKDLLRDMRTAQRDSFRGNQLGFVFQHFNLIPYMTVLDNVLAPLFFCSHTYTHPESHAQQLLEHVGIPEKAKTFPHMLSGGQQQRVALARALIKDPELIIADEPTGNLDPQTEQAIFSLLGQLCSKKGKTLLVVSHSKEAAAYCDHTYRLIDGKLELIDTTEPS